MSWKEVPHLYSAESGSRKSGWIGVKLRVCKRMHLRECYQNTKDNFRKGLGLLKGIEATVSLRPQSHPRFCQVCNVPYAMKPKVEADINRLLELGVISPVTCSDWATLMVPKVKRNRDVRICGDFKLTVNPQIEDLFTSWAGGQHFTKLDFSNAYLQVPVWESSPKCL